MQERATTLGSCAGPARRAAWRALSTAVLACVLAASPAASQQCGDPSDDEEVTAADALETLHVALGLEECDACVCDCSRRRRSRGEVDRICGA